METLSIEPFNTFARAAVLPVGSKSITNRALILAAASGESCLIKDALFSRDTELMVGALSALGFEIASDVGAKTIFIRGGRITNRNAELFVGNAGTVARFLTAFVAACDGGEFKFDSDAEMYKRPMKGLFDALRAQGAEFEFAGEEDRFPFTMRPRGLRGGVVEVDASLSSQIVSALMLSAGLAKTPLEIKSTATVSKPFVEMTREMLGEFPIAEYRVEPDATAAGYFAMLPVTTGGVVALKNFGKCRLQGDVKFVEMLEKAGILSVRRFGADMVCFGADEFSNDALELDFNDISDTFLTLASAAVFIPRRIKITGIAHTRGQETDRVQAMAGQLEKLAESVIQSEDSLEIVSYPAAAKCRTRREIAAVLSEKLGGRTPIETFNDHRIAMSFAVLGCADIGRGAWIEIENPDCVGKTWREFFTVLGAARESSRKFRVVAVDGGAAVGKSSVSKAAAASLGYMHVDTGAHYRNLACILLENNLSPDNPDGVKALLASLKLSTRVVENSAKILCNGRVLQDSDIRSERVNAVVSNFAAIAEVREFLKNYQRSMREFAAENGFAGLIMEGRDIGSVIFPDANARIFLDADEETRAARRAAEGITDSIKKRDALDRNRKVAPLVCPEGAVRIDTSHLTKDEVVAAALLCILDS